MKNRGKIILSTIGIVLLTGLVSFLIVNKVQYEKYNGLVKVNKLEVESSSKENEVSPSKNISSKTDEPEEVDIKHIDSYSKITYKIKYRLETIDNSIQKRVAQIRIKINDDESRYASFDNEDGIIEDSGKTLLIEKEVETNKDLEELITVKITNAPNGFKLSPKVEVKEKTSEATNKTTNETEIKTTSIEGTIENENEILKNALVELYKVDNLIETKIKSTYTDERGIFVFSDLKEGEYKVKSNGKEISIDVKEGNNPLDIIVENKEFNVEIRKTISKVIITENGKTNEYNYENVKQAVATIKKKQK